jgi:tRNA-specific 2-thiouridylase
MSGGVDSSLTAALLKEQGYDVTGVYMKNWTEDLPGMRCPWADDLADAKRVAVQLGIDFKVYDFETDYREKVVEYMIDEYKAGRTPNPDIMCNQEVKFKLFLEMALADGAGVIATGHYAIVSHLRPLPSSRIPEEFARRSLDAGPVSWSAPDFSEQAQQKSGAAPPAASRAGAILKKAVDANKDQTYFLYRVTGAALAKTLFPLGEFTKPQVREMAKERNLFTADKKDSQGICFVGQIGVREFLAQYVSTQPGNIIDKQTGVVVGRHDGAIFYTLGQRHGLNVGGGLPYYVVGKNMDNNEVYVTRSLSDGALWKKCIRIASLHWINETLADGEYDVRVRHRAPLIKAEISLHDGIAAVDLADPQRAVTAGQSVVIYDGETCLGGGVVV